MGNCSKRSESDVQEINSLSKVKMLTEFGEIVIEIKTEKALQTASSPSSNSWQSTGRHDKNTSYSGRDWFYRELIEVGSF